MRRAQADGKATAGLETLPEELGGLIALSREDQVRMLDETLDELKDIKSEMADIVTAWRGGDAARLATLLSSEYKAFPALYRPLVLERNERWLPQIEQLLQRSAELHGRRGLAAPGRRGRTSGTAAQTRLHGAPAQLTLRPERLRRR